MLILLQYFIFIIIGIFAGITAGLLGLGGGIVVVPALAIVFMVMHVNPTIIMHVATGTSLATMVFTSIFSIISHNQRRAIIWKLFFMMSPGIVIGSMLGAFSANLISTTILKIIFSIFLLIVAVKMFFLVKPKTKKRVPKHWKTAVISIFIGMPSGLLGIGAGTLGVPFLTRYGVPIRKASGIAAACGLPIAIAGTITVIFTGWHQIGLPQFSSGYVHWPSVIGVSFGSLLGVNIGARLSML
ncbi:MAG: sulfite exporter TauE/SafE family protein, partial [Pseudomonadota bacterium]